MKARNLTKEQVINDVLLQAQPTKEFVTSEQVAALALFLCGDDASADHRRQPVDRRRLDRGVRRVNCDWRVSGGTRVNATRRHPPRKRRIQYSRAPRLWNT